MPEPVGAGMFSMTNWHVLVEAGVYPATLKETIVSISLDPSTIETCAFGVLGGDGMAAGLGFEMIKSSLAGMSTVPRLVKGAAVTIVEASARNVAIEKMPFIIIFCLMACELFV
jgi:hypothetical protein